MRPPMSKTQKEARDQKLRDRFLGSELTLKQLGEEFGLDHSSVSHLLREKFGLTARDGARRTAQAMAVAKAEIEAREASFEAHDAYCRQAYGLGYEEFIQHTMAGNIRRFVNARSRAKCAGKPFDLTYHQWLEQRGETCAPQ
jgi:hypothetical protein